MTHTQKYADAVTLAVWGLDVLPLKGKAPLTRHGHRDATTNQAQIAQWWARWPNANVGARPAANTIVFDIDPRNGGEKTWRRINMGEVLPQTLVTRTGSGGLHIWFRLPYAAAVNKTAGDGVDLKTHRGYLVMPGSTHPATGRPYVTQSWHDPNQLPELPDHLHRYVYRPPAKVQAVIPRAVSSGGSLASRLINDMAGARSGSRNETLNRCAFVAYRCQLGISDELASAAACAGLPESEIMRTLASARRAAQGAEA